MQNFMNDVQEIFDAADEWERKLHNLMLEHAGMDRLLQVDIGIFCRIR